MGRPGTASARRTNRQWRCSGTPLIAHAPQQVMTTVRRNRKCRWGGGCFWSLSTGPLVAGGQTMTDHATGVMGRMAAGRTMGARDSDNATASGNGVRWQSGHPAGPTGMGASRRPSGPPASPAQQGSPRCSMDKPDEQTQSSASGPAAPAITWVTRARAMSTQTMIRDFMRSSSAWTGAAIAPSPRGPPLPNGGPQCGSTPSCRRRGR